MIAPSLEVFMTTIKSVLQLDPSFVVNETKLSLWQPIGIALGIIFTGVTLIKINPIVGAVVIGVGSTFATLVLIRYIWARCVVSKQQIQQTTSQ